MKRTPLLKTTKTILLRSFICFIFIFSSSNVHAGESAEEAILRAYLTSDHRLSDSILSEHQMQLLCVEMGEKAIPILKDFVAHRNRMERAIAVDCLLYIDSSKIIDILRRASAEGPSDNSKESFFLKDRLNLAMSAAKSTRDIEFLMENFNVPRRGTTQSAAFSLAVLKAGQARPALEKWLVKYGTPNYPMENDDIRLALDRINGKAWHTPQDKNDMGRDSVIFAVLRFGIPRTSFADVFFDPKDRRIWKRQGDTWTYGRGTRNDPEFPRLSFDVFISRDGNRASCEVTVGDGPMGFLGHTFILRKENNGWRVIRLMQGPMT